MTADGGLQAKYTVASLSDMYDYSCTKTAEGLTCRQAPDYEQWCETLMVNGRKCSLSSFQKLDETVTETADFTKGIESAEKIFATEKEGERFNVYKSRHNSLGNKLQGLLYVRVDEKECRLLVTDNYMTYYNQKRLEDSNPNGKNPFVKNDQGELLWEDCETPHLFDTTLAEYPANPEDIQLTGAHSVGTEVHYWLLHDPLRYAEAGCSYSFDVFHNYKPIQKGLVPEKISVGGKEELRWHFAKKFDAASGKNPDVLMVTTKTSCEGKPERKITACNKVAIQ